jgi:hypothetical protein
LITAFQWIRLLIYVYLYMCIHFM